MIRLGRAFFALFLIGASACAQDGEKNGELFGRWMNTGKDGDAIECPDLLIFYSNGRYSVFNDCYGIDPKNPLIESGRWIYSDGDGQLQLNERVFVTNYSLWESSKELRVRVEKLSDNVLTMTFSGGTAQSESYKKIGETPETNNN